MTILVGQQLRIEQLKWPDRPHYEFEGTLLGRDEHGRWLGVAEGTEMRRGPTVVFRTESAGVICVPDDQWYVIHYPLQTGPELYVDVVTPPVWSDEGVSMVDLDLDVVREDGVVRTIDRDEFERNRAECRYPHDVVMGATSAAERIASVARARRPPFTPESAEPWHSRMAAGG